MGVFTADELNRTALYSSLLQPIDFMTLTSVANNAPCNWVNFMQVSPVQFSSSAVNRPYNLNPNTPEVY